MDKFLKYKESWFDEKYRLGLDARYHTFRCALNILYQTVREPVIVEAGCMRQFGDWGGGQSTLLFAEYVARHGGHLITIDNNPYHMDVAKAATEPYADHVLYLLQDSVDALSSMVGFHIDLLYLDSMDYPLDGSSPVLCQTHNLREFRAAERLLAPRALVLLDDNDFPGGGKPLLTNRVLAARKEWVLLLSGQQALWWRAGNG